MEALATKILNKVRSIEATNGPVVGTVVLRNLIGASKAQFDSACFELRRSQRVTMDELCPTPLNQIPQDG